MKVANVLVSTATARRRRAASSFSVRAVIVVVVSTVPVASAYGQVGYGIHVEGAAAHLVGEPKASQFGWGGGGLVSAEVTVDEYVGFEAPLGGVGLADGEWDEPGLEPTGAGSAFLFVPGMRFHPFGASADPAVVDADGLWLATGGGLAVTGGATRPALDARVGYDVHAGPVVVGPFGAYVHIVEPEDSVRPDDARMLLGGIHVAFASPPAPQGQPGDVAPPEAVRLAARPEPTPDGDDEGELEVDDECPGDEETWNDYADEDGCPDEREVRVVGSEIVLDDRVHFGVNQAEVMIRSWPLLDRVARLLRDNPQYALVRVHGHADDTGDDSYNQRLSVARGENVRDLLIRAGVEPDRLVVEGFGESRPEAEGRSELARGRNRRVELHILERREVSDD